MQNASPVGIISEEMVKKITDTATTVLPVGKFDPTLFEEFLKQVKDENKEGKNIIITVTRRDDDFVEAGCIFAEIQTEPKKTIAIAGVGYKND